MEALLDKLDINPAYLNRVWETLQEKSIEFLSNQKKTVLRVDTGISPRALEMYHTPAGGAGISPSNASPFGHIPSPIAPSPVRADWKQP